MIYTYLSWMGIARGKVISIPSGVRARVLLYTPAICFRPLPFSMRLFRDVVFQNLNITVVHQAPPLLVFAERIAGKGSWRAPGNYPAIKATIVALCDFVGYKHQTVGDIAEVATIRGFATADVVVGVHGANLSPVIFMKPGASLVEFLARKLHPLCFYHVASLLGVEHYPIFYDFPHFHDGPPSVSLMHVVTQVAAAMGVDPERWALFVLHQWALRQASLASSGTVAVGLPITCSNASVPCVSSNPPELEAQQLFAVGTAVNVTPSLHLKCHGRLFSNHSSHSDLESVYVCKDRARGCRCSKRDAMDLLYQAHREGVSLSVSPHFTDTTLTVLIQLGTSFGCEPCRGDVSPFVV
jgi:hypothetical protein